MKITCFRISNGALAAKDLPKRLKVLAWGDNPGIEGINPKLGPHTLAMFPRLMKRKNRDKVAIDFEHNTVPGTLFFDETCEPRKVAGYGVPSLVPGDGLFLDAIEWTPCGTENARNYIDLSPAVHLDDGSGEVDFLHSVALTRAGALEGLSFFSVEAAENGSRKGEEAMDWRKWLLGFTGKGEETKDEDLAKAFEGKILALCAEAVAASEVHAELDAIARKIATFSASGSGGGGMPDLTALTADLALVKGEVSALKTDLARRDREALCAQAAREGKVIPLSAEQIAAMDLKVLSDLVAKLPVTVPVDRRTPEHIQALSAAAASGDALETIARRCGMDPETVRKANTAK